MQRPVVWLAALLVVACSDHHPLEPAAARPSPASSSHDVTVTDPDPAYGILLTNSVYFTTPVAIGDAIFGPQVISMPDYVLDGSVVRTPAGSSSASLVPGDGCQPFSGDYIVGKIVLIDRAPCNFTDKVLNAQNAGAIAVIIRDNVSSAFPLRLGGGDPAVVIPAFSIPFAQGTTLANAIVQTGPVPIRLVVTPVTEPFVRVPDDITVNATSATGAAVTYHVSGGAFRNLLFLSCSKASGSTFPVGTTTVTCTTTDIWGHAVSADFHVIVRPLDTTPPTITAPQDLTVELTSPAGAAVTYPVVGAIDDDGQSVAVTCAPASGSMFPLGSTAVTCTATDAAGNTATASFVVRVLDTTAPALTLSPNVSTDATSTTGAIVNFAVTATDASGSAAVTCTPPSGATFPIGNTAVMCQAVDPSGNTSTGSFTVTVKGPSAQIIDLQAAVAGLDLQDGTETSVQAKLSAALTALAAHNLSDACGSLGALINQINAQTGKKISAADAQVLIMTVQRIRSAAGC